MPLVATEVNEEIHKALRVKAAEDHVSLKSLLQRILVAYVEELNKA